jgi:UDP-N-acetylmuramate dehydrogenase
MKPIDDRVLEELSRTLRGEVKVNEPLAPKTTYRVGGPARIFVCPQDVDDLRCLNQVISNNGLSHFVLGGGANVLFSDQGVHGVVVHLKNFNRLNTQGTQVTAGAGCLLDELVVACLRASLSGLEGLSGIPGTLGGALRMNAGAFGAEISDYLVSVECLEADGNLRCLGKGEVGFAYRTAPRITDTYIMGATFDFPKGSLEELFVTRQNILAQRAQKQPWQYPSAGSVFKRPPGHYAGLLIEEAGLRGRKLGKAQISSKHAGIIINLGEASADDILGLIRLARTEVLRRFGICLELEQELVGFEVEEPYPGI